MNQCYCSIPSIIRAGRQILSDIEFTVNESSVMSILGKNGAGKTTLIRSILSGGGEDNISVKISGVDLSTCTSREIAQKVSHLGSSDFSKPDIRVKNFLLFSEGIRPAGEVPVDRSAKLEEALLFWGISEYKDVKVSNLSQGEFQRVLLGTVFLQESDVYLLDEPETHLDPLGLCLLEKMCRKKRAENKIIIMASHDISFSVRVSDQILGLNMEGKKEFLLSPQEALEKGSLNTLFGVSFKYVLNQDGEPEAIYVSREGE
jgi:iron complex transport system ATP-binding protein